MVFDGCTRHLGCTVLIRGYDQDGDDGDDDTKEAPTRTTRTGRALKRIMGNSIFYAHHLKLEASMLLNFRAVPQSSDPPTWELESLEWPLRGGHLIFTSCMLALNTVPEEAQCTSFLNSSFVSHSL